MRMHCTLGPHLLLNFLRIPDYFVKAKGIR